MLTEPNTDKEIGIQESSVSLFYNLISEYHLEDKVYNICFLLEIFIFNIWNKYKVGRLKCFDIGLCTSWKIA